MIISIGSFSPETWKCIREAGAQSLPAAVGVPTQRVFVSFPSPSTHLLGYFKWQQGEVSWERSLSGRKTWPHIPGTVLWSLRGPSAAPWSPRQLAGFQKAALRGRG